MTHRINVVVQDDALRELVTDATPADDILNITVCEPAMGSAAFLNEAVNQLVERYLERKQRELGRRIEHADYAENCNAPATASRTAACSAWT